MAKHYFGIMNSAPGMERYDAYIPERFGCIPVEDTLLDAVMPALTGLPCFWHTLARPGEGLAYCGVTLIPPDSLTTFLAVLQEANEPDFSSLITLLEQAVARQNFVIHFGL